MFQTLAMDIKPPATVNASPPAVPVAVPENPIATVNSTGPASPHDVSQSEDAANSHGGARRPGNLWTTEDREDMFNRREAGEGWETICADYPNRSRHAMQQQYSMMKKQKALADGTWSSNRRGRKRRNPAQERAPAAAKRSEGYGDGDEHMTEGDDFDEATSDDIDDPDDPSVRGPNGNGRPGALLRSSTEPVKSGRARNANYGAGSSAVTNGNRASSQQAEAIPEGYTASGRQSKKRRLSSDQGPGINASTPSNNAEYQPANVMLDYEEVFALLRKGVESARRQGKNLENELAARATSYTQAIGRANRRANDAHERYSYNTYEHGEIVKKLRSEFAETLKTKTREHKETIDRVQADFDEERRALDNHVRSLSRQLHDVQQQLDLYKKDLPDREKMMAEEIDKLKADNLVLENAKREWESAAKTEVPASASQINEANDAASPIVDVEAAVYATCKSFNKDFDQMSATITKFQTEIEDLNHKRTVQYLVDIVGLKDAAGKNMEVLDKEVERLHQVVADSATKPVKTESPTRPAATAVPAAKRTGSVPPPAPVPPPAVSAHPPPPSIHVEAPAPALEFVPPPAPPKPDAESFKHEGTDLTPIREEPATPAQPSATATGTDNVTTDAQASTAASASETNPVPTPATAPAPPAASERPDVEMQDQDVPSAAAPPPPIPADPPMPPPGLPATQPAPVHHMEAGSNPS